MPFTRLFKHLQAIVLFSNDDIDKLIPFMEPRIVKKKEFLLFAIYLNMLRALKDRNLCTECAGTQASQEFALLGRGVALAGGLPVSPVLFPDPHFDDGKTLLTLSHMSPQLLSLAVSHEIG